MRLIQHSLAPFKVWEEEGAKGRELTLNYYFHIATHICHTLSNIWQMIMYSSLALSLSLLVSTLLTSHLQERLGKHQLYPHSAPSWKLRLHQPLDDRDGMGDAIASQIQRGELELDIDFVRV